MLSLLKLDSGILNISENKPVRFDHIKPISRLTDKSIIYSASVRDYVIFSQLPKLLTE